MFSFDNYEVRQPLPYLHLSFLPCLLKSVILCWLALLWLVACVFCFLILLND